MDEAVGLVAVVELLGHPVHHPVHLGVDVPARVGTTDGSLDLQLARAISMDTSAANACQGATFTVSLATGP